MICPDKVRDICLFGMMCPREPVVDDDGECAAYIRSALALMDARADQAEVVEVRLEREAIREEVLRDFKPTYLCEPYRPKPRTVGHLECEAIGRSIQEGFRDGLSRASEDAQKLVEYVKRMCENGPDV